MKPFREYLVEQGVDPHNVRDLITASLAYSYALGRLIEQGRAEKMEVVAQIAEVQDFVLAMLEPSGPLH